MFASTRACALAIEVADRSAEAAIVERAGHVGIGVDRVAVVRLRAALFHATSFTAAPGGDAGAVVSSAAQACRVRSR